MGFRDLLDPERALSVTMKFAIFLICVSVAIQFFACMIRQMSLATGLTLLCASLLVSPVAYVIRRHRQGRPERPGPRRGAERTPLLPQNGDAE